MPTLASGQSTSVTILAGQTLDFQPGGQGTVTFGPGAGYGQSVGVGPGASRVGPFPADRVAYIYAQNGSLNYVQQFYNYAVTVDPSQTISDIRLQSIAAISGKPSIWFPGDSHTGRNQTGATYASAGQYSSFWGFMNHAQVLNGQKFNVLGFAGIGGQTIDQIAARLMTDYAALGVTPNYVCVLAGTNNVGSESAQSVISKLRTLLWAPLRQLGVKLIVCTLPPVTNATPDVMAKTAWINDQIRKEANSPNTIVVDFARAITEPSTGNWRTISGKALSSDNTHGNTYGANVMGQEFNRATASTVTLGVLQQNGFGLIQDPLEYLPNPFMAGNNASGTNKYFNKTASSGASGTGPNGVFLSTSAATTTAVGTGNVARIDGLDGVAFQVACSFANANDRVSIYPSAQNLLSQDFQLSKIWGTRLFVPGEIVRPTTPNGFMYRCINSAPVTPTGSEPLWPSSIGATVTSGGATWLCISELDTSGAEYEFAGDFSISALTGSIMPSLDLTFYDAGYTPLTTAKVRTYPTVQIPSNTATLFQFTGDINVPNWQLNQLIQLKTLPFTIPAGLDHFVPQLTIWGDAGSTCTILVHRLSLRKIASI